MRLATSEQLFQFQGLEAALERWLRPAVGFAHPRDVLKDPHLDVPEKRAILSSWASDASAVPRAFIRRIPETSARLLLTR